MALIQTYSTRCVPRDRRLDYWNNLVSGSFNPCVCNPRNPREFNAHLSVGTLGFIKTINIGSSAATVKYSKEHVAKSPEDCFHIVLQKTGRCLIQFGRDELLLRQGDFIIFDNSHPYNLKFDSFDEMYAFSIPSSSLARYSIDLNEFVGVNVNGDAGIGRLASSIMGQIWPLHRDKISPSTETRIASNLLDFVIMSYLDVKKTQSRPPIQSSHRTTIQRYIETNLNDPQLSPSSIAKALRMTPRYLHMLFSEKDETISRYILRRRLEECEQRLADPLQTKFKISDIAYDWGFTSTTHFHRVFKEKYGVSPRKYQKLMTSQKK